MMEKLSKDKDIVELRKAAKCVFLVCEEPVAKDLSDKLNNSASMIEDLRDLIKSMTGCGYDFCQHEWFVTKRDELLKGKG